MKPIFIAASPNTQQDDSNLAFSQLLKPWEWYDTEPVEEFENEVERYLGEEVNALAIDSARSAFYLLLKAYGIGKGDEVILPSFSCLVVANPVLWVGANPVYVDVNKHDFNLDLNDLKSKVTNNTKAILVQHTFGMPIDVSKVREIVGPNVKIIEDTAHSLGGTLAGKKLGTLGDAAILTFGIEKVISTVRGGMAVTKDKELITKLRELRGPEPVFSRYRIFVSLLNPVLWSLITPVYYLGIGKFTVGRIVAGVSHWLKIFGNMIEECEYKTSKPDWLPAKLPGALARLGLNQIKKLDQYNEHRIKLARKYSDLLNRHYEIPDNSKHIYLRFPILVDDPKRVLNKAKQMGIVLGDWYKNILYAPAESLDLLQYIEGTTKNAEYLAKHIINLPTGVNVTEEAVDKIATLVKENMHSEKSYEGNDEPNWS
ncbi:DegT/DnrJ/EryC1/StrS family aminotransferase [Candidatus Dojkabacteria bacterium]|uniref:DegT/DnrJ/EryC1/StrS family aminotransferase n=1 Tax=Candidatus Dojkabacteria bacterium TaxID=2099670 RepID=A0A955L4T6_9BACT|nr:DegT/DnrJ/EryC1/StrS family aminotransferase [Candidatus Dojkabacteria bacterium]